MEDLRAVMPELRTKTVNNVFWDYASLEPPIVFLPKEKWAEEKWQTHGSNTTISLTLCVMPLFLNSVFVFMALHLFSMREFTTISAGLARKQAHIIADRDDMQNANRTPSSLQILADIATAYHPQSYSKCRSHMSATLTPYPSYHSNNYINRWIVNAHSIPLYFPYLCPYVPSSNVENEIRPALYPVSALRSTAERTLSLATQNFHNHDSRGQTVGSVAHVLWNAC